ncbi:MAG: hypothetical protein IPG06_08730 [Haliea sp.]|nr:hypothetical protein [Haliea sp.]
MNTHFFQASLLLSVALLTACASNNTATPTTKNTATPTTQNVAKQQVMAPIPVDSPFSKIKVGMPNKQVHDLIGTPTDTKHYTTGKAFIPFYFGNDTMRLKIYTKGQGRIVYTGWGWWSRPARQPNRI